MKRSTVTFGKRKEVEKLMESCEFTSPTRWGPYTQITAIYKGKVEGFGQARKTIEDADRTETGDTIARYRATTAVLYKLKGLYPHHPLMG